MVIATTEGPLLSIFFHNFIYETRNVAVVRYLNSNERRQLIQPTAGKKGEQRTDMMFDMMFTSPT